MCTRKFCRYIVVSQPPDQLEFSILFCINRHHNENCSHLKYNHTISWEQLVDYYYQRKVFKFYESW